MVYYKSSVDQYIAVLIPLTIKHRHRQHVYVYRHQTLDSSFSRCHQILPREPRQSGVHHPDRRHLPLPAPLLPFCGVIATTLARRFKVSLLTHYGRGAETQPVRSQRTDLNRSGGILPPSHNATTVARLGQRHHHNQIPLHW